MVTGRIRQKRQYYHMVIKGENFKDKNISTGVKAEKPKDFDTARKMLDKVEIVFDESKMEESIAVINSHISEGTFLTTNPLSISKEIKEYGAQHNTDDITDMYYADYILYWVKIIRDSVTVSTYSGYNSKALLISDYFKAHGNPLVHELTKKQIQDYMTYLKDVRGNSAKTMLHHRGLITTSLNYIEDELEKMPTRNISIPKKKKPKHFIRTAEELKVIIECALMEEDYTLAWAIYAGGFLSYRREESMGASWSFIDLDKGLISVYWVITQSYIKGEGTVIDIKEEGKTRDSERTHLLDDFGKKLLVAIKEKQEYYKQIIGKSYNHQYDHFVMTDELGNLIRPDKISKSYTAIQTKMGYAKDEIQSIKDLRHSCASDLNSRGRTLKDIQDYLGHSNTQITSST